MGSRCLLSAHYAYATHALADTYTLTDSYELKTQRRFLFLFWTRKAYIYIPFTQAQTQYRESIMHTSNTYESHHTCATQGIPQPFIYSNIYIYRHVHLYVLDISDNCCAKIPRLSATDLPKIEREKKFTNQNKNKKVAMTTTSTKYP